MWNDVKRIFTLKNPGQQTEGNRGEMSCKMSAMSGSLTVEPSAEPSAGVEKSDALENKHKDMKNEKVSFRTHTEVNHFETEENKVDHYEPVEMELKDAGETAELKQHDTTTFGRSVFS